MKADRPVPACSGEATREALEHSGSRSQHNGRNGRKGLRILPETPEPAEEPARSAASPSQPLLSGTQVEEVQIMPGKDTRSEDRGLPQQGKES